MRVGTKGLPWSNRWKHGIPNVGSCQTTEVVSTSMAWRRCGQPLVETLGGACTVDPERHWLGANPAVAHHSRTDGKRCQSSTAATTWAISGADAPGILTTWRAGVWCTRASSWP